MYLNSIDIFLKVVQEGSFSKAARLLGLPNSTVSVRISQLEDSLGVTLLTRTTRKVTVTELGMNFYKRCVHAIEEIELAKAEASQSSLEPIGLLRVTCSMDLGQSILPQIVKRYLDEFPRVEVELVAGNKVLDIISEKIDIAIRIGSLEDSSLKVKKLGTIKAGLYCHPKFLEKSTAPSHPKELDKFAMVGPQGLKKGSIKLFKQQSSYPLRVKSRLWCDDPHIIKSHVLQGIGIGILANFHVLKELEKGSIVRILPEWSLEEFPISLVYPEQRFLPNRVRRFIDLASEEFEKIAQTFK